MTAYTLPCVVGSLMLYGDDLAIDDIVVKHAPPVYFKLDETSGGTAANAGTLGSSGDGSYSGPTLDQMAFPGGGNAPLFDGVNDSVNCFSAALAAVFDGNEMSFQVWMKFYNSGVLTDGTNRNAFAFISDGGNYGVIRKTSTNNESSAYRRAGGATITQVISLSDTDWHLVTVVVSDAADEFSVYLDDALVGTQHSVGTFTATLTAFRLGSNTGASTTFFYGYLAHGVIYSFPLTLSQITSIYNAGIDTGIEEWTLLTAQRKLTASVSTFTLNGQDAALHLSSILETACGTFTLSLKSVTFYYALWEPSGDMLTLGTLLTRIQNALGDPNGSTWDRTEVIWPFAVDAIRDFPILRPKSIAYTVTEAGHSFSLPADFRKVIYVEFPPYEDPPAYLARKPHTGGLFYGEDGFYDVDRDYDEGEGYILWVSNSLAVDDIVIVRYLAAHTTEFANEYSYITIENQYVQVIISHVVMMCYQERLALQLQDPTAHTSTIQQRTESVKTAESNYQDQLKRAMEDVSSSQRVEGWKADKYDRIY